jgi:hypothetical protein
MNELKLRILANFQDYEFESLQIDMTNRMHLIE